MSENDCFPNPLAASTAKQLNSECFCRTLDRLKLAKLLPEGHPARKLLQQQPQLFADTSVFISRKEFQAIERIVLAIDTLVSDTQYQQRVLENAPDTAQLSSRARGIFNAIDLHMAESGPQIIEVNTNGGGAFLNAALIAAQIACCDVTDIKTMALYQQLDSEFVSMICEEWQQERGQSPLKTIAIIDENPTEQFLYPEFLMAQYVLTNAGFQTFIASPDQLAYDKKGIYYEGSKIDLIYNRLTDFYFSQPTNINLKNAYLDQSVVVTPNPHHYALYANKQNLIHMSDPQFLASLSLPENLHKILLSAVPRTRSVDMACANDLWQNRKHLFFKPAVGFGSRAAYRGDKITQKVWTEILNSHYVAQQIVPPNLRAITLNNEILSLKMDIRVYIYQAKIQLLAARLYQGQTTNFRTPGGGFAPVWVTDN